MGRPLRVALHCRNPALGDVAANVAAVVEAVRAREADLVVFPEMHLTGYAIGDDAQRLALTLDDARLEPLRKAVDQEKVHVVAGGPRKERPGVTHNSAFCLSPDGQATAYDKRSLATFTTFREGLFFRAGRTSPVWSTAIGGIGLSICYDLFFPEFHRRQALAGADLLLNISASPTTSQRFFETLLPARAVENACFMAYSNCVGAQDAVVFWGGAQAFGPRGHRIGRLEPMAEGRLVAEMDFDDLAPAREFRPTLRDAFLEDVQDLA